MRRNYVVASVGRGEDTVDFLINSTVAVETINSRYRNSTTYEVRADHIELIAVMHARQEYP